MDVINSPETEILFITALVKKYELPGVILCFSWTKHKVFALPHSLFRLRTDTGYLVLRIICQTNMRENHQEPFFVMQPCEAESYFCVTREDRLVFTCNKLPQENFLVATVTRAMTDNEREIVNV